MSSRERLIRQLARQRGLDDRAVVAVAMGEGGLVNRAKDRGDGGRSFGPFQLYEEGALPRHLVGRPDEADAWAWSREGIGYATRKMADSGCAGLKGKAAVDCIVRRFERPADPDGSAAKARARLGGIGGGPTDLGSGGRQANVRGGTLGSAASGFSQDSFKSMVASTLLQRSMAHAMGAPPEPGGLLALAMARQQMDAAEETYGPEPTQGSLLTPSRPGRKGRAKGEITELFHDPLGGIKHGKEIGAIGGHDKHVHMGLSTLAAQQTAINQARRMGLAVREDGVHDAVDPVHTDGSYHYRKFKNSKQRQAADISGDARRMQQFYRWVQTTYG